MAIGYKGTILVVDDDEKHYPALLELLAAEGFKTLWAPDTIQALAKIGQDHPDLIIIEIMLVGENGLMLCDGLKKMQLDIPVFVLSKLEPHRYSYVAEKYKVSLLMKKPFNRERLLQAIYENIAAVAEEPKGAGEKKSVLVVEDDEEDFDRINECLCKAGYRCLGAHDTGQALVMAGREKPDIIIMEAFLKGEAGFGLCERLKQLEIDLPIIILSRKVPGDYQPQADKHELHYLLQKPVDEFVLLAFIEEILDAAGRD